MGASFSVSRQLGLDLSLGLGPGRLSALRVIFFLRELMSIFFSFALFSLGRFKLTVLSFFIFLWGGSVLVVCAAHLPVKPSGPCWSIHVKWWLDFYVWLYLQAH